MVGKHLQKLSATLIFVCAFSSIPIASVSATPVTLNFEGVIDKMAYPFPSLYPDAPIGTLVTGRVVYDPDFSTKLSDTCCSAYYSSPASTAYIEIQAGNHTWKSDQDLNVSVVNDWYFLGMQDRLKFESQMSTANTPTVLEIEIVQAQGGSRPDSMLSSADLPSKESDIGDPSSPYIQGVIGRIIPSGPNGGYAVFDLTSWNFDFETTMPAQIPTSPSTVYTNQAMVLASQYTDLSTTDPIIGHLEILTATGPNLENDSVTNLVPGDLGSFNSDYETVVIVHGWDGPGEDDNDPNEEIRQGIQDLAHAVYQRHDGQVNVVIYNWEYESEGGIDSVPAWKTGGQGENLALALDEVFQFYTMPDGSAYSENVSFIGHSLGTNVAVAAVSLLDDNYNNIGQLSIFDGPENNLANTATSGSGVVQNADGLASVVQNNPDIFIDNYVSVGQFGVGYDESANIFVHNTDHTGILLEWYGQTIRPYDDNPLGTGNFNPYGGTDVDRTGADIYGYSYDPSGPSPLLRGSDYFNIEASPAPFDLKEASIFQSFPHASTGDADAWEVVGTYLFLPSDILPQAQTTTPYGAGYYDSDTGVVYGVSNSPLVFEFVFDLGVDEQFLSFDYFVDEWFDDDAIFAAVNGEMIFLENGLYLDLDQWNFSGLVDVGRFSGSSIVLTIGLLTDAEGTLFKLKDIFSYRQQSVPEPGALLLLIAGLMGLVVIRRQLNTRALKGRK